MTPRYALVYLFEGEAASWHARLTKQIVEKFNTWRLDEYIPPHVTIFRPFKIDDIQPIKTFVRSWIQDRQIPGNILMSGFDHFEDRVVFADIKVDPAVQKAMDSFRVLIEQIPGIPPEDFRVWHPHATLANQLTPTEINQIWEYVKTLEKPNFDLPLNNITLLINKTGEKWEVEEGFRFKR